MRYVLDTSHGAFTVQAFAQGALSALGHNPTFAIRTFTGDIQFAPEALADAAIRLTVQADSLALTDSVAPKDREEIERRMREEALETASYREIVFQSTEISANKVTEGWYRLGIGGKLSLHGVTNAQRVDAQFRMMEDEVHLSGECTLSQSAYRVKRISALAGMITLKDELKLTFDLIGRKPAN